MNPLDWAVLLTTLAVIVGYGSWKTRKNNNLQGYLLGDKAMKWHTIGLSIMATQASAITFLSTPGQAYDDGMRFIQFYFGLPIAMVILSAFVLPIYYKLNVFTAYEYLEKRFDLKTRMLTAFLFLVQRGLAAGITIYAPAIILSTVLGWDLNFTNLMVGVLVIIYTVSGGTRAVSLTQKWQMAVIMSGMFIAFGMLISYLPDGVGFGDALQVAGKMGKMNVVDLSFDFNERYTLLSGLTGGLFLAMSYFGTDQSQVQRYLSGRSITESRLGLMFNGLLKVPMQFFILLVGVLVFVFYQFERPPVFFNNNDAAVVAAMEGEYKEKLHELEVKHEVLHSDKKESVQHLVQAIHLEDEKAIDLATRAVKIFDEQDREIRDEYKAILEEADDDIETKDTDYVFITFVMNYLPTGLIGLLLAVILSAAMSSTAGELNALASTTTVDFYKRIFKKEGSDLHYLVASRWITVGWGVLAIIFAVLAHLADNLIELVNILGSLFYGTILGIFMVAFFIRYVKARAIFIAAFIGEATVLLCPVLEYLEVFAIGYLWYNVIGCLVVVGAAVLLQRTTFKEKPLVPEEQES